MGRVKYRSAYVLTKRERDRKLRLRLESEILDKAYESDLFSTLRTHDLDSSQSGESHTLLLIKLIIKKFINLRLRKISNDISEKLSQIGRRSAMSRLLIVKNI